MNPWDEAFGVAQTGRDPNQEGRIDYLYQLAEANPTNKSLSEAYNQAYMDYMYPQANPLMEMLGMGGGQQQQPGVGMMYQGGGVDPMAYTAMMEGQLPREQYESMQSGSVMGANNAQIRYDENGQPYLDIPDDEFNQFEQGTESQGTGSAIKRNVGAFFNSPASLLTGAGGLPYAGSQIKKQGTPLFEGDNEKKIFNAILKDPTNLFRKPSTLLGISKGDYYNRYQK